MRSKMVPDHLGQLSLYTEIWSPEGHIGPLREPRLKRPKIAISSSKTPNHGVSGCFGADFLIWMAWGLLETMIDQKTGP